MPSNRRLKYLLALVALALFITLYYSSDARQTVNADFYQKTKVALEKSAEDKRLKAEADAELQNILKHAKDLASGDNVAEIATTNPLPESTAPPAEEPKKIPPRPPGSDEEVDEISVAGRKTMPKPKPWAVGKDEEVALNGGRLEKVEEPGMAEAKAELNNILKKSPRMSTLGTFTTRGASLIHNLTSSNHLLKVDMPILSSRKVSASRYLQDRASPLRCGARSSHSANLRCQRRISAYAWPQTSRLSSRDHRAQDCTQRPNQRPQHWRQRRGGEAGRR
jgi:hypothetical protein